MTDAETGWLAGIIDGEGCILIQKERTTLSNNRVNEHYQLCIAVTMTHEATVRKIQELCGSGSITHKSMEKYNRSDVWYFRCTDNQAARILRLIRPHLITKADEADLALRFAGLPKVRHCKGGVPPELQEKRELLYQSLQNVKPSNIAKANRAKQASNH